MSKKKNSNLPYTPYTYLIWWSPDVTGLDYEVRYYGCRYAEGCHPDLFWVDYFTSSEKVAEKRKEWGDPSGWKIRKTWENLPYSKEAGVVVTEYETRVLKTLKAAQRKDYLNGRNGSAGFSSVGMVALKDNEGKTHFVPVDDPRKGISLLHPFTGMIPVKDSDGKIHHVSVDDPRLGNSLWHVTTGKTPVRDSTGKIHHVSVDDPRIGVSLWRLTTGKTTVKDEDGNTMQVSSDDPRIGVSLHGVVTGKTAVKDKDGNTMQVDKNDPRIGVSLWGVASGKIAVKDKDGNTMQVDKNDPRIGVSLWGIGTGKTTVKDKDGNTMQVDKNDPRIGVSLWGVRKGLGSTTGKCCARVKSTGKKVKVSPEDGRFLTGELIRGWKDK